MKLHVNKELFPSSVIRNKQQKDIHEIGECTSKLLNIKAFNMSNYLSV